MKYFLLVIYIGSAFNALATQSTKEELIVFKEKIEHAIVKVENTHKEHWSYTIFRFEDEEGDITSSIEQYSPQAGEKWLLKQVNGQEPTQKQIRSFAKKKQGENLQLSLRQLINQESLSLVSTDDKHIIMAFNVNWKKLGEDSVGKLQGKLKYQKENQFIEEISIWNNEEFSPMFTAEITDLALTFSFLHINGAVLSKQYEMKMKGSFAYFTEIDEISLDRFSDYLYQGE